MLTVTMLEWGPMSDAQFMGMVASDVLATGAGPVALFGIRRRSWRIVGAGAMLVLLGCLGLAVVLHSHAPR